MPYVYIKNAVTGAERTLMVAAGGQFSMSPGEAVVRISRTGEASTDAILEGQPNTTRNELQVLREELDIELGGGFGNFVKAMVSPIASLLGKSGCTACEARRVTLNAYAKLKVKYGNAEALRIIQELWALTKTSEPIEVLKQLKKYLAEETDG